MSRISERMEQMIYQRQNQNAKLVNRNIRRGGRNMR